MIHKERVDKEKFDRSQGITLHLFGKEKVYCLVFTDHCVNQAHTKLNIDHHHILRSQVLDNFCSCKSREQALE